MAARLSGGRGAKIEARSFGLRGIGGALVFGAAVLVIARTLAAFALRIEEVLSVRYDWRLEIAFVLGQVAFQWAFLLRRPRAEKLSYAWVLIAVSSLGAALLWPLVALERGALPLLGNLGWFFAVVGVMFAFHWLLVVRYRLPKRLCVTWVVYRLLLLVFVARWH
jgi:hypothetical protein